MKLFQKARTGKTKWKEIYTEGGIMITKGGLMDSTKEQEVRKVCKPTNVGKDNENSAEEQAQLEAQAKIKKATDNGYLPEAEFEEMSSEGEQPLVLSALPKSFRPCKPISQTSMPKRVMEADDTYAQRKHNGHCVILLKDEKHQKKVFSRGMEDITDVCLQLPFIYQTFDEMPKGTFLLTEVVWTDEMGKEHPRKVAEVIRQSKHEEALARYKSLSELGSYVCIPFDIMFYEDDFIGTFTYRDRYEIMLKMELSPPELIKDWKSNLEAYEEEEWEGLILRIEGESAIGYSTDGKAYREGSWKYKFVKEDDFVVTGATLGKSGKHADVYARFELNQYDTKGKLASYGHCGTGKLTHDYLKEMTKKIDSGELTFPFVVEIEYQSRHEDTGKVEFPILQRLREDKKPKDCICEEVF